MEKVGRLEKKIFNEILDGKDYSLTEAAIVFSGVNDTKDVKRYLEKYQKIIDDVHRYVDVTGQKSLFEDNTLKLKIIYNSLNNSKLGRYLPGQFLFSKAIDLQTSDVPDEAVGDCRALTYLTTTVANDMGVKGLNILESKDHMKNSLNIGNQRQITIENNNPNGFMDKEAKGFRKRNIDFILPYLLYSRAAENNSKDPELAIEQSTMAIGLCKDFGEAYINRAIGRINTDKNEQYKLAIQDLETAQDLGYEDVEVYLNLGKAFSKMKDNEKALLNLDTAMQIDSMYPNIHLEKGKIFYSLGNFDKALKEFESESDISVNQELYDYIVKTNFRLGNIDSDEFQKHFESKNRIYKSNHDMMKGIEQEDGEYFCEFGGDYQNE